MKKLAIITTHPIQYNAPLFKLLHQRKKIAARVFYTWGDTVLQTKYDPGFEKNIGWDIPLLEGTEYEFSLNISDKPGSHHFMGIQNPHLINSIITWKADAILVYGWAYKSHLQCIRYFHRKIPVFFRGDSNLFGNKNGIKALAKYFFLNWVFKHVDKVFYVGSENKKYFLKYGLKEAQLIYAPNAVDISRFAEKHEERNCEANDWRIRLGILPNDFLLLFAGKFEEVKNPFFLIELMKNVANPNLKLLFVGNGILEKSLKMAAAKDSRILFLPFQNQSVMPVLYRLCDAFILPSKSETWGLALNEAMASKRPVIASDQCGGANELVQEGINGKVFTVENPGSLITFLETTPKEKFRIMGEESFKIIQDFNYERICTSIENELNRLPNGFSFQG